MITIRRSAARGHANHGWLDTWHTFSFAGYYDEKHLGFSQLRVINQDRVQPGRGFSTHGHENMEIISYVLEGVLEHQDSMGNGARIRPGEVQFMSAGSGVTHSEFNGSADEEVHLLQMWVRPAERDTPPRYGEKVVFETDDEVGFALAVSPDGRDDTIRIGADVSMYVGRIVESDEVTQALAPGRRAWLHVARGVVELNGETLEAGDGAAVEDETRLRLRTPSRAEFVLFDLP